MRWQFGVPDPLAHHVADATGGRLMGERGTRRHDREREDLGMEGMRQETVAVTADSDPTGISGSVSDKRTRIVCTIGPSSESVDVMTEMIGAGMNVARLNMSHGDHDYHRACMAAVREASARAGRPVAIMIDTKGPEIRTGLLCDHTPVMLEAGATVRLVTRECEGTAEVIPISYAGLPRDVRRGTRMFIGDGLIALVVESTNRRDEVVCRVVTGGELGEKKGLNVPGVKIGLPSVTERDMDDIRFACREGADAIAASFVRDADTVRQVKFLCKTYGRPDMVVFAKLESVTGLRNLDDILSVADGIMIARGDLGVEMDPAELPYQQKRVIRASRFIYKPTIVATQMLESMTTSPRPTRAEVTDVANAIYDGCDCVMLSGETAIGAYPVETVRMMAKICSDTEKHLDEHHEYHERGGLGNINGAIGFAAVETAKRVGAVAIMCPTRTGRSARLMSVFRSRIPLIGMSPSEASVRRMCFYWGVTAMLGEEKEHWADTCRNIMDESKSHGFVEEGDIVIITTGDPETTPYDEDYVSSTNICMIAMVR